MPQLTLPAGFALPDLITELAPGDTMFDGRVDHYLCVGLSARKVIEAAMTGAPAPSSVLDLPCGFGRVTRILRTCYPAASMTVCDLDRAAVDFTAATFRARGVYSTPNFRDLRLDGPFDLIWVGSLLTHLPEHQTRQFLDFAVRHMGPNSRLVVTSHGEHVASQLRAQRYGLTEPAARGLIVQYLCTGYGYRGYDGDPTYGISLVARAWYETLLDGSALRLQAYYERGWDRHQDVLVMRSVQTGRRWRRSFFANVRFEQPAVPLPLPAVEQASRDAQGVCRFDEGWYRTTFSDVASAVQDGAFESGLAHYLSHGWREGRPPFDPAQTFVRRADPASAAWLNGITGSANRIEEVWSVSPHDVAEDVGWYWMAHPTVRARSNTLASGDPNQDAYHRLATLLQERGWILPIKKSVSIGCGFGGLERDLSARRLVVEMDAYDIAAAAVAEAERQARELGLRNIRYHVANLETLDLPPQSVEAVFAHSSVHDVERLEALFAVVQQALRPGGVFHLHVYVGPTRFQWTDPQLELANRFLDSLPPRLRRQPNGELKARLRRPTIEEMIAADPSEAIRSADLVGALTRYFDIVELRPLGGTLVHIALGGIAQNFAPNSAEDDAFLQRLFAIEDEAMASGIIGSDFATITAIPRPLDGTGLIPKRRNGPALAASLTARAASLFPRVRRLHEATNYLNATVITRQTDQDRMTEI